MLSKSNIDKCVRVLAEHDAVEQLVKLSEECAELGQATLIIIGNALVNGELQCTENFCEELSDVMTTAQEAMILFHITDDEINERSDWKLERTLRNWRKCYDTQAYKKQNNNGLLYMP